MKQDIIRKLAAELIRGVTTEVQVVYLLVGIRKLIELDNIVYQYQNLKFHCDWALHSSMDRKAAKGILKEFDAAHEQLQGNKELHDMPMELKNKIEKISKMLIFKDEFLKFLDAYRFPPITLHRYDGWVHFVHLYVKVIEDIPLVVAVSSTSIHGSTKYISHVTVHFEAARETVVYEGFEELFFKVTWKIYDKNGQSGEIFIINSFSV